MNPLAAKDEVIAFVLAAVLMIVVGAWGGFELEGHFAAERIDAIATSYKKSYDAAVDAKVAAEKRASDTEANQRVALATAATHYEEVRQNEKAASDRTIADLRSGLERLRVRTVTTTSGGQVPGAANGAGTGAGASTETLDPAVAARLAGRYAEYNALVDRLNLCQDALEADRATTAVPADKSGESPR